jgi:hypothetical protein
LNLGSLVVWPSACVNVELISIEFDLLLNADFGHVCEL